jgi:hypothetical protein
MLKAITAATILITTTAPLAAETDPCEQLGQVAATVMEARQAGVPLSTVMDIMDSDLGQALALDAYNQPRYRVEENQLRAIEDFRNEVERVCYGTGV